MSDLEINVALAKAMGWVEFSHKNSLDGYKSRIIKSDGMLLSWDVDLFKWRMFDYRDPVIFVAICKHWKLVVNFDGYVSGIDGIHVVGEWEKPHFIEKAAALVVIELAKRGVK